MNCREFSDGFDTLVSSYANRGFFGEDTSKADVRLDEYEKSFLLTKAQEELVINLYNGKNLYSDSFESTEEMRRYLANLVKEAELSPITNSSGLPLGIDSKSKFFTLPDTLWFITYEAAAVSDGKCGEGSMLDVVPVTQDEYHKIKRNPFRGANGRRALRLDLSNGIVEIVCKYTVTSYYLRYLNKLSPIILVDLPDGLTIEGKTTATECALHSALHQKILEIAVEMGLRSKGISLQKQSSEKK